MIARGISTKPRLSQRNVLRCHACQRLNHDEMTETFDSCARSLQQVTNVMIRVTKHDADVLKTVAYFQPDNHFRYQRFKAFRLQQAQLTLLRRAHFLVVAHNLCRELLKLPFRRVELGRKIVSGLHLISLAEPYTPDPSA